MRIIIKNIVATTLIASTFVMVDLGPDKIAHAQSVPNLSYDSESALYSALWGLWNTTLDEQVNSTKQMAFYLAGTEIYIGMKRLSLLDATDTATIIKAYRKSQENFMSAAWIMYTQSGEIDAAATANAFQKYQAGALPQPWIADSGTSDIFVWFTMWFAIASWGDCEELIKIMQGTP